MKVALISLALVPVAFSFGLAQRGPASPASDPSPVRYMSTQRVLAEASDARALVARVQAAQQQAGNDLRTKQQALEATRGQLAGADPASRARLLQQEVDQRADIERTTAKAQADLQILQRQMQTELQGMLRPVLDELLKGQGVQMVLNAETSVVWAPPELDLTAQVIERLNARGQSRQ